MGYYGFTFGELISEHVWFTMTIRAINFECELEVLRAKMYLECQVRDNLTPNHRNHSQ